jgi:metal-responsive CopG/Arc/MetJ family transcriptional regulator
MKAIQVSFDERLLDRLDADAEVKRDGRSAVLRRAAAHYLKQKRRTSLAAAYKRAYVTGAPGLDEEFAGWEDQGVWPAS